MKIRFDRSTRAIVSFPYSQVFVRLAQAVAGAILCLAAAAPANAEFPDRPIRVVVPAPAGGGADIVARRLAEKLTVSLGQQVIVDNRPGASGNLAADLVAKAKPDGHTLLLTSNGVVAINPWLFTNLPYDPAKDLVPVVGIGQTPAVVVVREGVPARSLVELVALAKSKAGVLTYGSGGIGSPQHITGELFKKLTGTDLSHVPYKGSAPVIMALLSGEVDVGFEYPIALEQHVRAGKLRPLAISGPKRIAMFSDVPTVAQAGYPAMDANAWVGYFAPAGTPPAVIDLLNRKLIEAATSPDFAQFVASQSGQLILSSPQEFGAFVKAELARWGQLVKASGARIE